MVQLLSKAGETATQDRQKIELLIIFFASDFTRKAVFNNLTTQKLRDKAKARKMCL